MKMGKAVIVLLAVCLVLDVVLTCLFGAGMAVQTEMRRVQPGGGKPENYTVRGVDVSEYQGKITWEVLAAQGIDFAYIKATKGSGYKDKKFEYNWQEANKTHLKLGAYHLFTFNEPAQQQAANFIAAVPDAGDLPPAVDVELYGDNRDDPPDEAATVKALDQFLDALEGHYGKKPVIYATKKVYDLYISGNFADHPVWVRNPKTEPVLPDGRKWTLWQYNNDGELKGYEGESRFIDLNLFNGTEQEFEAFTL